MTIKGWQGTTTLDYPGRIASIIFTGGCNLRCDYCHNMSIVASPASFDTIPESEILCRLKDRVGFIDGLVVSGGEPTIQNGLLDFLKQVKDETALAIKLDTNGLLPKRLDEVLSAGVIDYAAMDIKTSPANYPLLLNADGDRMLESMVLLRRSGISYEFRTTCAPGYVNRQSIISIAEYLQPGELYYLQPLYDEGKLISKIDELRALKSILTSNGLTAYIRGHDTLIKEALPKAALTN